MIVDEMDIAWLGGLILVDVVFAHLVELDELVREGYEGGIGRSFSTLESGFSIESHGKLPF